MSQGSGLAPLWLHRDVGKVNKPNFIKGRRSEGVSWEVKKGMGRASGMEGGSCQRAERKQQLLELPTGSAVTSTSCAWSSSWSHLQREPEVAEEHWSS